MALHLYYAFILALMLATIVACVVLIVQELTHACYISARRPTLPKASVRRIGGLWFFRFGRFGGSIYIAKG